MIYAELLKSRLCIEETILHFNPDISDRDLLDLREDIYYKVARDTKSYYARNYYLYSRERYV